MTVGILALQGDVREHATAFADIGVDARPVRREADLRGIDGIVLPGGESTTLSLLLDSAGLFGPLAAALGDGLPAFGTCAGLVLLSSSVLDGRPDQRSFGTVDCTVRRNGYGRQRQSFECPLSVPSLAGSPDGAELHAVFIRAPVVEAVGPEVEVLAEVAHPSGGPPRPVLLRQGPVLASTFHPELTGDRRLHRLFSDLVAVAGADRGGGGRSGGG